MNFRRRSRLEHRPLRLPLIALIDVVLFLLLYFIIAGSFGGEESSLAATLSAKSGQGGQGSTLSAQVLRVEVVNGVIQYRLGGRSAATRAELASIVQSLPRQAGLVIKVANDAPVAAAAVALQVAHDTGFRKISYAAGR